MLTFATVIWGARCGKPARRVLLGETRSRDHAYSVRRRRESALGREAPHRLLSSRLVSTIRSDQWADRWRRRNARGEVLYVRYADDILAAFEHKEDAQRFLAEMRLRLEEFKLTLHPEKTRLIEFGRFAAVNRCKRGLSKPETSSFLGFIHISGCTRTGRFQLKRKTRRDRMRAKLKAIKEELRRRMHEPIPVQGRWLAQVVRGYFAYHAVPTNFKSLTVEAVDFFNLLTGPELLEMTEALLPEHRERLYPPTETLSMYMMQVLSEDGSCQKAVDSPHGLSPWQAARRT